MKEIIESVLNKYPNLSALSFDIKVVEKQADNTDQFPDLNFTIKKIYISCSSKDIDSFKEINDSIKQFIEDIEKNIDSTYLIYFIFKNSSIKFWNEKIDLDSRIVFSNCKINVNIHDTNEVDCIYLKSKNFQNCTFENLSLLSSDIKLVQIDLLDCPIKLLQLSNIITNGNTNDKIKITNSKIDKILIKNTEIKYNFHIEISQTIDNIEMEDVIFKKDFCIYNSLINKITIINVDFESLAEFNEVQFENQFDLQEITYKGFTLFDNCVFNTPINFKYIVFEKFTSFRGTEFNEGINLDFTSCDKEIHFFGIKNLETEKSKKNTSQETYRIIKYNLEKLGNKIEANKYHAFELEKRKETLQKEKWKNPLEYIVFKIHWLSSEYSTNWLLPILWMIIFGILFSSFKLIHFEYILFLLILISLLWSLNGFVKSLDFLHRKGFKNSFVVFGLMIIFISLGQQFNISFTEIISSISLISIDTKNPILTFFNKILMGYLYYQFVISLRKDTRK